MKAVILAAGASSRMRPLTNDTPKCLVEIARRPMLRRAIDALSGAGVRDFVIITGYLEDQVRAALPKWELDISVEYRSNPVYATHNNGYSVLVARDLLEGQTFLLLDGDVVFEKTVIESVLASDRSNVVALRTSNDLGDEEMKVECDAERRVRIISKSIEPSRAAGEAIGITKIGARSSHELMRTLDRRIIEGQRIGDCYEDAFQDMMDRDVPFYAVEVRGFCADVDTPDDRRVVESQIVSLGWT